MTFIVDLLRRGDEHGNINVPIVSILLKNKLIDHIWISRDSTSNLCSPEKEGNLVTLVDVRSTKRYKWITSIILTVKILILAKRKNAGTFFLSATPLQNLIITLFTIFQRNSIKHYVLLHGELSYLISPNGIGRLLGKFFLSVTFKILPFSKTTQITLAYPVYVALKNRYKLEGNLINLEMPIDRVNSFENPKLASRKLRIGSFGVHSGDKSSHLIYDLNKYLFNDNDRFDVVTIGVANTDFIYDQDPMVTHYCKGSLGDALIPRSQFVAELKKLDIALFFYGDKPQYEFISSGAFVDCISYGIPFAALSNNYLIHYTQKYGEIGIVANSLADLAVKLINISRDDSILEKYKKNLENARNERNFDRFEFDLLNLY